MDFIYAKDLIEYISLHYPFFDGIYWEHEYTLEQFDIDELMSYLSSIEDSVLYFYLYKNTASVAVIFMEGCCVRLFCF